MEIKVRTLKIAVPVVLALLVAGVISYTIYDKNRKKKIAEIEYQKDFEQAVEREYKMLLRQYNNIVEAITDYDYSYDFRERYLGKLNKLLEEPYRYTLHHFDSEFTSKKDEDKELLKSIARRNVFFEIMGVNE